MEQHGSVRVVNLNRWGTQAEPEETIVRVDRSNPVLGNPFHLRRRNDPAERDRVIALYARRLQADQTVEGPMTQAIRTIAEQVLRGEQVALACWCRPLKCHAEVIAQAVEQEVEAALHAQKQTEPALERRRG